MAKMIIDVPGVNEAFMVKRKKSRSINMSLEKRGVLRISIPYYLSYKEAGQILRKNRKWVEKYLSRMKKIEQYHERLTGYKDHARIEDVEDILTDRVFEIAQRLGLKCGGVKIKEFKTKWGSCSCNNLISLNSKIMSLPRYLIDYVIVHELVHTRVKNHRAEFWSEVEKYLPGSKAMDRELRQYSPVFI